MVWLYCFLPVALLPFTFAQKNDQLSIPELVEPNLEQIRSPLLEVFMHLPPNFRDSRSLKKALESGQERLKRNTNQRKIVEVRNYEIAQPIFKSQNSSRVKRETAGKPEPEKLVTSQPMLPTPDAIRGPAFPNYPVKEFDVVDIDDPDDPRRRRNDSSDGPDDNSQRDKRTFLEEGSGETTTPLPFWKRKKENPPFVTGRGGSVPGGGNSYTPAQHRAAEGARESHSLKNLDKSVQSNEISRTNQDTYFTATNRRTYSRQFDGNPTSTPKSVYDTIDYTHKKPQEPNRVEFGRGQDSPKSEVVRNEEKKDTPREVRPTHEQYRQYPYNYPWMYDRQYYQPPFPYPTEILGRGLELYHRTFDPSTGRIIYYANMPEQGRNYDYRYIDPVNRNYYVNRPYYDPFYRSYVPPYDYRYVNNFGRSMDYLRTGRASSQAYSYPFQEREREKYPRDARVNGGGFETLNRPKNDFRNKTYIIYDAEERRPQFPRPQFPLDNNRASLPVPGPSNNSPGAQIPFKQFPFPPVSFPLRTQFHPSSSEPWGGFGHRSAPGVTDSRAPNSREVQLPLTSSHRVEIDKSTKS